MNEDLERKLAALAGDGAFDGGAMQLGPSGGASAMAAVVNAIDTTMLPRHVVFTVGASSVTLNVAGKRLRNLVEATDDLKAPKTLVDRLLATDDTEALTQLGEVLGRLTALEGQLALIRKQGASASGQSDAGVSVGTLISLWDVDPDAKPPSKSEQFAHILGELILSTAQIDGKSVTNTTGDPEVVNALETMTKKVIGQFGQQHASIQKASGGDTLVTMDGLLPGGALLSSINANESNAVVASKAGSLPQVAAAWARVSGQ